MAIRCVRGISAVFAAGVLAACGAAHEQIGPSGTDPQVVQGAGHMVMIERATETLEALAAAV